MGTMIPVYVLNSYWFVYHGLGDNVNPWFHDNWPNFTPPVMFALFISYATVLGQFTRSSLNYHSEGIPFRKFELPMLFAVMCAIMSTQIWENLFTSNSSSKTVCSQIPRDHTNQEEACGSKEYYAKAYELWDWCDNTDFVY
jgi:hypothetical protein